MQNELPYPIPDRWQRRTQLFGGIKGMWGLLALFVALAVASVFIIPVETTRVGLALATGVGLSGMLASFGLDRFDGQVEPPKMINAVTLTKADHQVPDSWVHFFREKSVTLWASFIQLVTALVTIALLVWLIILMGERDEGFMMWIPIVMGVVSVVYLAVTLANIWHRVRDSSFGRIPIGVTLGQHGIARRYLADISYVSWEQVHVVKAQARLKADDGSASEVVQVTHDGETVPLEVWLNDFESQPWLIYSALRFYAENPEARRELSNTGAQKRMESWNKQMLTERAAASGSPA